MSPREETEAALAMIRFFGIGNTVKHTSRRLSFVEYLAQRSIMASAKMGTYIMSCSTGCNPLGSELTSGSTT
jgi:hypothetical protein